MSALVGPVAGALVAGGVYYGFSNLIQTRTEQHRRDLRVLSLRLSDAPAIPPNAPTSAAARIQEKPFTSLLQSRWNTQMESVFKSLGQWDERVADWGRESLYGGDASSKSS